MPIRPISRMGHPILRERARGITPEELRSDEIQRLIDDMVETMREAHGVGLAAPQVFEGLRLITAEVQPSPEDEDEGIPLLVLANPAIVQVSREMYDDWEGCLSIPDIRGLAPRHIAVRVEGLDRHGEPVNVTAEGFFARILQHEIDHLDGILYLDRMKDLKSLTFIEEFEQHWLPREEEADELPG
ncbi:MAG: peptide deformylase [Armatimonadetes bacterium]|nr:peptide deformylase [Armatimonadota bacterium]